MKCLIAALFMLLISNVLMPQKSNAYIVGTTSFQDSIWIFNDPSWTVFSRAQLTLASFTVNGANSISWNPVNGLYYAIIRTGIGSAPRRLATVDPETGICTDIGDMGAAFSSLTFSPTGTLYAMGGQGSGAFSERLYSINTSNGTPTFLAGPFPLGADGEVIAYNSTDNNIYHWSGNSTALMEKIDAVTFIATPVPQSGAAHGEIFGAVYKGAGEFYATDIASRALIITSAGVVSVVASGLPDDIRGLGYGDPLLPVELSSFTSIVNGRDVTLNWATSTETNNSRFEIERSLINGSPGEAGVWSRSGFVNGNGTSATPHSYTFTDKGLISGKYNYRLKQIDFNGHFEYFNLSNEVIIGIPDKHNLSQNYPNPFNPLTTINFDLAFDSKVSITLFDISGREVASLVNDVMTAGYHTISFNSFGLSSGMYFYKLTAGDFSGVKKMTLLK